MAQQRTDLINKGYETYLVNHMYIQRHDCLTQRLKSTQHTYVWLYNKINLSSRFHLLSI